MPSKFNTDLCGDDKLDRDNWVYTMLIYHIKLKSSWHEITIKNYLLPSLPDIYTVSGIADELTY